MLLSVVVVGSIGFMLWCDCVCLTWGHWGPLMLWCDCVCLTWDHWGPLMLWCDCVWTTCCLLLLSHLSGWPDSSPRRGELMLKIRESIISVYFFLLGFLLDIIAIFLYQFLFYLSIAVLLFWFLLGLLLFLLFYRPPYPMFYGPCL